ncbi:MAG TPA: CusA/CzcA family heavy metal efflux RND transporter [Methylococcaceae bacterium]|nr:CusA/CzcA family heavy metal efflux RND transporter [Methylococcaceae bacterium]
MINRILVFCLQQRVMVMGLTMIMVVLGVVSFERLPIQAFPDVQNVFVQVVTQYPGQAPEEVEKIVTLPIEKEMNGLPHLTNMRSVSIFGLSVVTLTFDDDAEDYFSRQQVLERLRNVALPSDLTPVLGPLSTGVGEIFRYVLRTPGVPLVDQRALQDWVIEPRLRSVRGVADVISFGGGVKQYQVGVNLDRLKGYGIPITDVFDAISRNNRNTGGGYIEHGDEALVVRGVGLVSKIEEIGEILVTTRNGLPIKVKDLADVSVGPQPRTGIVGFNHRDDVVEGVVLLTKGRDPMTVLGELKEKVADLNAHRLPQGVEIEPIYDRTELIQHAVHTVEHNMLEGAALILIILIVFLRSAIVAAIVTLVIPLSLLFAFILIDFKGVSANLISLGAIDFGIIVDSAVVLVEAIMVKITVDVLKGENLGHMRQTMLMTASEMGRPILFSKAIIITAFIPIFTFQRVEAKIFAPMAYTLTFALIGSLIVTLTLIPVLLSFLLGKRLEERHNGIVHGMESAYRKILEYCLDHPAKILASALVALVLSLSLVKAIGTEFMPKLDEGNIWLTVTLPTPISLSKAKEIERGIRARVEEFPEAKSVLTQLGRPEDGTDPKGFNNLEILVSLQPKALWRYGSKDELIQELNQKLSIFPGVQLNFSQVIQDNVEEAISGVKGEIAVKIFGDDLKTLQEKADQVVHILKSTRGSTDVAAEQQAGLAQAVVEVDRAQIARYGISIDDVEDVIEIAVGGKTASHLLEGNRRFDIAVRMQKDFRSSIASIENLGVRSPDGGRIPFAELGSVKVDIGASRISREENSRRIAIKCNLIGRDQGGFVEEAMPKVAAKVSLPPGYHIVWSGQFENQQRAMKRLSIIVPISLTLIFILLFWTFQAVRHAILIVLNVPFALIGGLVLLWMTGIHLSVSAAVGFIALFGIAVQNGLILVSQLNALLREGLPLREVIMSGSVSRLRPVIMTALMAMLGLIPAALSTGVGSETAKPFAVVIIGGLVTSTVLTLTMLPLVYGYFERRFGKS